MNNKVCTFAELKEEISNILSDFPVEKAILFGSYAKGEADGKSDIDLVIDSNHQLRGLRFFGLKAELEDRLEKNVDLIDQRQIVAGGKAEQEIQKSGVIIYGE